MTEMCSKPRIESFPVFVEFRHKVICQNREDSAKIAAFRL